MTTPTACPGTPDPATALVHRPVRAHPPPVPGGDLTLAAPPMVGWAPSGLAGWLPYLVPLVGSVGSVGFLFAMPGPRPAWLLALVVGAAGASVVAGLALRLGERRATRRARRRERARYLAHLALTAVRADQLAAAQLTTAEHLHPDPPELWTAVTRADRLWERRPADADFLTVRVGRGPIPLAVPVRLDGAGDPLADHDPELLLAAQRLVRRATWLPDAPVPIALGQLGVVAFTGPPDRTRALARAVVCELAAFHAPDDLRILAAYPPAARPSWRWMERLPHTRDPTFPAGRNPTGGPVPAGRFSAAGPFPAGGAVPTTGPFPGCLLAETGAQLDAHLSRELRVRPVTSGEAGPDPGGPAGPASLTARPHLVAILDTTEPLASVDPSPGTDPAPPAARTFRGTIVDELLERPAAAGVTVIWLARTISGEPSELAMRVRLDDHGPATVQQTTPGGRLLTGIHADTAGLARCEAIARQLAPLELDRRPPTAPRTGPVRLLDLLDPGTVPAGPAAGAGSLARSKLLQAPIGTTTTGNPLVLDLKEAAEAGIGPHGLVVGATGSGKSELLRTIVAGLAATHPPEQLAFVLVDVKGGAAFAQLAPLPQVAGLITNLQSDLSMVDRAMAALQGELARRQRLLHQAGNQPDLRAYAAGRAADPRLEP
jgi:S-DNA-T family DNA segregation ATPase FtsK/SpoIIIE